MGDFDPGPPAAVARHFAAVPSYAAHRDLFWYDWGPIFYRGRLNRSARLLVVASDPGPTERIAGRTLVGDAGQRVQGFLHKVGLTRSYVLVNAFAYALLPSLASQAPPLLADPVQLAWRTRLLQLIIGQPLQAVVAFGELAQAAVELWHPRPAVPVIELPHPSSRDPAKLANTWRAAVTQLRAVVTPDADGDPTMANYGAELAESDYARIPARDLPWGLPAWVGDDAWVRATTPAHPSSVTRPQSDFLHTLVWRAPSSPPP